jgi:hypothetical protein
VHEAQSGTWLGVACTCAHVRSLRLEEALADLARQVVDSARLVGQEDRGGLGRRTERVQHVKVLRYKHHLRCTHALIGSQR